MSGSPKLEIQDLENRFGWVLESQRFLIFASLYVPSWSQLNTQ